MGDASVAHGSPFPPHQSRERGDSENKFMGAFTKLSYHIIFSTRYRRRVIQESFRARLWEYMGGTIRAFKGHVIEIGGVEDHVHILANLPATIAVSESIRDLKSSVSKWAKALPEVDEKFGWQKGYAAFTVSYSQIEAVQRYIQNQEQHHRRKTFQEEDIDFLQRHGIELEPRYLFESEHHG